MSLRLKIHLIVGVLVTLFVAGVLGLQLRSLREGVHEEVIAANRVAAQLLRRTAWLQAAQGTPAMLAFLQGVGRVRSNDIVLLDAQGAELYRSPPSPYKVGRDAPAWFAHLVLPAPTEQSIEFPDGRLVVRSDPSRAAIDAWDYSVSLVGWGLALVLAVNAVVFWVVGRTVRPFARIVDGLGAVEAGNLDVALPPLPGREAGAIGAAFNRMLARLRDQFEAERRALRAEQQLSDNRELGRWIDHHIEQERRMIARELHDEFGQSVTAIRSMALSIAERVGERDADSAQAARVIADESLRLYDAMHGLIPRLAPLVLDRFGLPDALRDLAERTRRSQPGLRLELQIEPGEAQLSSDAALALYRAAQEGLTNALRHGGAANVRVALRGDADGVTLQVDDDGAGLAPDWQQPTGHYGLRWLGERLQALQGRFTLEPRGPRGTRLEVHVPLHAEEAVQGASA